MLGISGLGLRVHFDATPQPQCIAAAFQANQEDRPAGTAQIKSLQDLVPLLEARLRELRSQTPQGDLKVHKDEVISKLLESYQPQPKDYDPFRFFEASEIYSRNLVHSGQDFDLVLLCWNPGMASLIHDHPRSNCHMKVLEGGIFEDLYEHKGDGKQLVFLKRTALNTGFTGYINDAMGNVLISNYFSLYRAGDSCLLTHSYSVQPCPGLHSIGNLSSNVPSVSLHLYSPPIRRCKVFNQETGETVQRSVSFHSEYGQLLLHEQ